MNPNQCEAEELISLQPDGTEVRRRCGNLDTRPYETSEGRFSLLCSVHYAFMAMLTTNDEQYDESRKRLDAMWVKIFMQTLQAKEQNA